jgi:hypothetical protein
MSVAHPSIHDMSFDTIYKDTVSVSLSTAYLFNYPMTSFARLPISLTISLSQFTSFVRPVASTSPAAIINFCCFLPFQISIIPPEPSAPTPAVTLSIAPDFVLDLNTTSLMGSRAKLANVPKLHELIQHQVRRIFVARGTGKSCYPAFPPHPNLEKLKEKNLIARYMFQRYLISYLLNADILACLQFHFPIKNSLQILYIPRPFMVSFLSSGSKSLANEPEASSSQITGRTYPELTQQLLNIPCAGGQRIRQYRVERHGIDIS